MWEQKVDYTEAFPHLLLTAFLQWGLNSRGCVERESVFPPASAGLFFETEGSHSQLQCEYRDRDTHARYAVSYENYK
jgi:hypothetical protein